MMYLDMKDHNPIFTALTILMDHPSVKDAKIHIGSTHRCNKHFSVTVEVNSQCDKCGAIYYHFDEVSGIIEITYKCNKALCHLDKALSHCKHQKLSDAAIAFKYGHENKSVKYVKKGSNGENI